LGTSFGNVRSEMGFQRFVPFVRDFQHGRSSLDEPTYDPHRQILSGNIRKCTPHQCRWTNWRYVRCVRTLRQFPTDKVLTSRHERALATTLFALAPFLGPVLGPIVGGFVVEKHGFRWVFWVQFIFAWYVPFFATGLS